jgi:hypothetical protein
VVLGVALKTNCVIADSAVGVDASGGQHNATVVVGERIAGVAGRALPSTEVKSVAEGVDLNADVFIVEVVTRVAFKTGSVEEVLALDVKIGHYGMEICIYREITFLTIILCSRGRKLRLSWL